MSLIPRIGLGCMALTGLYGPIKKSDAISVIHHALGLGCRHFDTAELYGPYANEELLAEALAGQSSSVTVATKVGYDIRNGTILGINNNAAALRSSVEGCLRRLRRDSIDLLYLHRIDARIPIEETVGVLGEFVAQGKAAAIGLSAVDSTALARAHAVHPIAAVQNEFSIVCRQAETESLPRAQELNIPFVAFSPLGRGILAGSVTPPSARDPSDYRQGRTEFSAKHLAAVDAALRPLQAIAAERRRTTTQIALAWLLAKSVSVIPGARSIKHVIDCCEATQIILHKDEIRRLDGIAVAADS